MSDRYTEEMNVMGVFRGKRISVALLAGLIWVVFFACGACVKDWIAYSHAEGFLGYDYALYVSQLSDPRWILYTGVRHPGLGLVLSPIVLAGEVCALFGECWRQGFFIAAFAAIAVVNVWLVMRLAGWLAAAVFLGFGWTWVLAAVPESFPVAMMSLLLVLTLVKSDLAGWHRWLLWCVLFVVCSAITITNGLKVVIAFLLVERCSRRLKGFVLLGLLAVVAVGIGYFYIRMGCWNAAHPEAPKTVGVAFAQTLSWIPEGLGVWGRVKAGIVNFFLVPVLPFAALPVEAGFVLRNMPTVGVFELVWGAGVYCMAVASLWVMRRSCIVQAMVGMFSVDVFIHLVCGWGLHEGWIFSAHWFYMLPIGIGLAWQKMVREHFQ